MTENLNDMHVQGSKTESKVNETMRWQGYLGENVFRILVPDWMVSGIIGRKSEFTKKIKEETNAHIK